jgi:hypothetical protein
LLWVTGTRLTKANVYNCPKIFTFIIQNFLFYERTCIAVLAEIRGQFLISNSLSTAGTFKKRRSRLIRMFLALSDICLQQNSLLTSNLPPIVVQSDLLRHEFRQHAVMCLRKSTHRLLYYSIRFTSIWDVTPVNILIET